MSFRDGDFVFVLFHGMILVCVTTICMMEETKLKLKDSRNLTKGDRVRRGQKEDPLDSNTILIPCLLQALAPKRRHRRPLLLRRLQPHIAPEQLLPPCSAIFLPIITKQRVWGRGVERSLKPHLGALALFEPHFDGASLTHRCIYACRPVQVFPFRKAPLPLSLPFCESSSSKWCRQQS